jgi:protoheme IX farnesyltransferase
MTTISASNRWLYRFSILVAASTFLLIVAGATVTSHRAGLSVPDWPTTYDQNMFAYPPSQWQGGILFEHSHRLIASVVGMLTIILTLWLLPAKARRITGLAGLGAAIGLAILVMFTEETMLVHRIAAFATLGAIFLGIAAWVIPDATVDKIGRRLGILALVLVIAQGALGGLTVLKELPAVVSIGHGALAQGFFCVTIAIALIASRRWNDEPVLHPRASLIRKLALATSGIIYLQLILGATVRHANHNHALYLHIFLALCVAVAAISTSMSILTSVKRRDFTGPAVALGTLIFVQLFLGVFTWAFRAPKTIPEAGIDQQLTFAQTWLPTVHLAVGALILACSVILTIKSFRIMKSGTATEPSPSESSPQSQNGGKLQLDAFASLAKPRIVTMVLVTTTLGYFLGNHGLHGLGILLATLAGVGLCTAGSCVLNNYLERDVDALMQRTRNRVLPQGVVHPSHALSFGVALILAGLVSLVIWVNLMTAFLTLLAAFLYVLVYTPMKRLTWLNTTFGAIPGAIPPMCGWAAATGHLELGAWVLFAILFAWQHPHFYAIAWMFRDDYASAGFKMLPVIEPAGHRTALHSQIYSVLLLALSIAPVFLGMAGRLYLVGAIVIGILMLAASTVFALNKTHLDARRLLKASVLYLPLLLGLIMIDAGF